MKPLQSKRGQMNSMSKMLNLILAIITAGIGVLGMFGSAIGFSLPTIPGIIIYGIISIAGIILILDAFVGVGNGTNPLMPRSINGLVGAIVLLSGVALLLGSLGIFPIPAVPEIATHILLMIGGAIMLLDGIVGGKQY